jgi:hypothetical protein
MTLSANQYELSFRPRAKTRDCHFGGKKPRQFAFTLPEESWPSFGNVRLGDGVGTHPMGLGRNGGFMAKALKVLAGHQRRDLEAFLGAL